MLGVCLGMQGLVTAYGGRGRAGARPRTARWPRSQHDGRGVFRASRSGSRAVRYHSLAATGLPAALSRHRLGAGDDGVVMGVRHTSLPLEGVQFHPESVLSEHGAAMIANFLAVP